MMWYIDHGDTLFMVGGLLILFGIAVFGYMWYCREVAKDIKAREGFSNEDYWSTFLKDIEDVESKDSDGR